MTSEAQDIRRLYLWSLGLRSLGGFVAWLLATYYDAPLLEDARFYESLGVQVASEWLEGERSVTLQKYINTPGRPWVMVTLLAIIYTCAGGIAVTPVAIVIYSSLTALTPVLIYRISRQLGAPVPAARFAGWLVALSPGFLIWSGALYKEGLILVVLSTAVYQVLVLQERIHWWGLLLLGVCVLALLGLRFYMAIIMGIVLTLGLLLGRVGRNRNQDPTSVFLRQILLVGCFGMMMVAIGFTDQVRKILPEDLEGSLARMQRSRQDLASYRSGYLRDAQVSTPEEALLFLPQGLFYFLTVPLPWQFGSLRQNLVIPETAFWILLYPLILVGMRQALRRNFQGAVLLITATIAVSCFYALFVGNIGTAYRMRMQVWVLWAVFAGWGWHAWKTRRIPTKFPSPQATVRNHARPRG
jgi:hypothetical protein